MAKPKKRRKGGKSGGPATTVSVEDLGRELASLVEQLRGDEASGPLWGQVHKLLLKSPVDNTDAARLIAQRNVDAVADLATSLVQGTSIDETAIAPPEPDAPAPDIDPETMRKAMRAFRKRLKLTRLDSESKLGVGPLTGGKHSEISMIIPPNDFSRDVWDALAREGKLRDCKQGFYELTE